MSFRWDAKNYREIVDDGLGFRRERRPRGAVKRLADSLRCHTTFVAQVLSARADFSQEQGLELCRHFAFGRDETEFFLTLLCRDRAGTKALRAHYERRLDQLREARRNLSPREAGGNLAIEPFIAEYFGNWSYQAVHALTQVERFQTAEAIADRIEFTTGEVKAILARLGVMGLVRAEGGRWRSMRESLHLDKSTHLIRPLHITWKSKQLADLHRQSTDRGTRYSGLITVSETSYHKVRDILVRALREIRDEVEASPAMDAYVLSVDCYEL